MLCFCNHLSVEDYCRLRSSVGWAPLVEEQAQSGLENSDFIVSCRENDKTVGCARIFWDKGYIAYLADVIVMPEYQGKGIGRKIIETLEQDEYFFRAKRVEVPASITGVGFYRKLGYEYKNGIDRPDEERLFRLEKFR